MRKLTDVYIKVTKGNVKELNVLLKKHIKENDCILFEGDCIETLYAGIPNGQQKVSLAELKRLIDTIPTRDEIKRLKQQISAYKMNYDKVVKHSLSKEDVIGDLQMDLNRERSTITDMFEQRKEVHLNHYRKISVISEEIKRLKSENDRLSGLYFDLLNENAQLKQRKWWHIWINK